MKFADAVKSFLAKSFGGGEKGDPEEKGKDDPDLENQDGEENGETEDGENMEKSLVDATDILGSLVTELKDINKSLKALTENQKTLEKSHVDVGEAVVGVAEMVAKIAGAPVSTKSVMAKGNLGGPAARQTVQQPAVAPTQDEFERAQGVLVKAVAAGEITLQKSEMISSSMQKAMVLPGYKMPDEYFDFLARKMQAA